MPTKLNAKAKSAGKPSGKLSNADRFLSLPDVEKERIFQSYNREVPLSETRPMTPAERRSWKATQARLQAGHAKPPAAKRPRGRPVVGKGAKGVQVTIEGGLLAKADAYAKRNHMKRSELVAAGLRLAMASGVTGATAGRA